MDDNMISVLHIDPERGWRGGQQQAVYLYEGLLKKGIETNFICRPKSKLEKYFRSKCIEHKVVNIKNEIDIISAYKIAKYAKENKYKFLQLHSAHALSIGILAKIFYRQIKLICVRRVDFSIRNKIFGPFKYTNKYVDKIITISHAIKRILIRDGVDVNKIVTIHSGIDVNRFKTNKTKDKIKAELKIQKDQLIIGTVAAMADHKDYPNLLNAASIVINKRPDTFFIAVGGGKDFYKTVRLSKTLNISNNFMFTGNVNNVEDYYKIFDVFVLASKREGMGTSLLDAQAQSIPVIGTDAGGIPEVIQNGYNGIIVLKQNPQKLAQAILTLVNNKDLREEYSKNCSVFIKTFEVENTINKNILLYKELLNTNA